MSKFVPRVEAPSKDNKYYFADNIYYKAGSGMPGCPAYAFGRLWEITGQKPKFGLLNACDWFEEAKRLGYEVGNTPKLGAVACWAGAGSNPYGHVSIVEELFADKSFRASESSSSGLFWNNGLIVSPKDNYAHPTSANHYPLQGFIYCGIDFDEEPEEKTMWRVQTGAYSQVDNTINMYDRLVKDGYKPIIKKYDNLYHVQVGAYSIKTNALNKEKELAGKGYPTHITTKTGVDISIDTLRRMISQPKKGNEYTLNNCNVYASELGQSIGKRSGKYYVWSNEVKNGRIRMTNAPERCGVGGQVSFWVAVSDLV